jgi:hypothetical protein
LKDGKLKTDAVIDEVKIQRLSGGEKICVFICNFFGHLFSCLFTLMFGIWYTVSPKEAIIF